MKGSLATPRRSLLTMAIDSYNGQGDFLRQVAKMDHSRNERSFSAGKKEEILKQLRLLFKTAQKNFNFALINASKLKRH